MFRFGDAMSILARSVREPSGNSPALHALEQVQVLLDGAVAVRALLARFGQRAAILADLLGGQVADVGLAGFDQLHRPLVELVEIVGGVEEAVFPVEAQPAHVFHDGIDVLGLFLARIGVVEAQIALAAEFGAPARSPGRSTSRGRCADSRSAPAESASARARRTCWTSDLRGCCRE